MLATAEWDDAIAPIRRQVSRTYLEKTKKALEAGLFDAGVNYTWDLVVNDLRLKVEAYGIDIFLSVEDGLTYHATGATLQDRWREIGDHRLLAGCLKLNLISRTAYRHLSFWLSVRNHESAAHPIDEEEELDLHTAVACVRDAARFVLCQDLPMPGFNLKNLADNLKTRDLSRDAAEIHEQVKNLTSGQCDSAVGMMVSLFVGGTPMTKSNVLLLIKPVWQRASDEVKRKAGEKYAKLSAEGESSAKAEVFAILTVVDGVGNIPTSLRRAMFQKASKDLIDAHFNWDNFANEIPPARQLAELGVDCPDDALDVFCAAFLVSFVGNFYGPSIGAQAHLQSLKQRFTLRHWTGIIQAARESDEVQSEIFHSQPYKRLQVLCSEMLPTLVSAKDKGDCEFIVSHCRSEAQDRFARE